MTKREAYYWTVVASDAMGDAEAKGDLEAGVFFLFWLRDMKKFLGLPMGYVGRLPRRRWRF